jgi:hypothetical protein
MRALGVPLFERPVVPLLRCSELNAPLRCFSELNGNAPLRCSEHNAPLRCSEHNNAPLRSSEHTAPLRCSGHNARARCFILSFDRSLGRSVWYAGVGTGGPRTARGSPVAGGWSSALRFCRAPPLHQPLGDGMLAPPHVAVSGGHRVCH